MFNNQLTIKMSAAPSSLPPLYGSASNGKQKIWTIEVRERDGHGVIIQKHGYVDGKLVENERVVTVGKNVGKRNATTPFQQAMSEATAMWNKKRDAAYATASAATAAAPDSDGDDTAAPADAVLPMLAKEYTKNTKHIQFPCYAQRKLDGVRCVAIPGRGLFSRNAKQFPHLEHICAEINTLDPAVYLDGELYSDTLTFQEIVGIVKKEKHLPDDAAKMNQIYLYVYDCIIPTNPALTYKDRNAQLVKLFETQHFHTLRLLPTDSCESAEDVKRLHATYVADGYEGLMLRNICGVYKTKHRSNDLQKYKEFVDAEYPIVGFREGDGVEKGCVIWVCCTPAGLQFAVRPRGTHIERQASYANGARAIGKLLTVRYQELTTDGIPRFPVGLAIRDYE